MIDTSTLSSAPAVRSRSESRLAIWELLRDPGPARQGLVAHEQAPRLYGPVKLSSELAHRIIKAGIPSKALGPLGEFLGLGKGVIADYLDLDRGTALRRVAKDQLLPTHAAEGLLRLLELDQLAQDTFETEAEALQWLREPHALLDGETPFEAAKTSFGAQRVKDMLLAIQYGGVV